MLPKKIVTAYIGLLVAYVIWSAAAPVIKYTLNDIPPYTFLFLRFLIVAILILPYTLYLLQRNRVHKSDYFNIALIGLFSQTSLIIFFVALKYTTALDATIISTLGPLFSMVAGHYFYRDKLNAAVKLGAVVTLVGAFVVTLEPLFTQTGAGSMDVLDRAFGNLLILVYNLTFLLYVIWSKISLGQTNIIIKKTLHFIHIKPMSKEYPGSLLTALSFYVGLLTMIPAAVLETISLAQTGSHVNLSTLGVKPLLGLLYMAVFSSIVAYFAFERSLKSVTVSDTALLGYIQPLLTMPFAFVILGELPTQAAIFGGLVIFGGVIIAEYGAHRLAKRS